MESSQLLKDDGIVIIALGVSSNVNTEQLQGIASYKEQVLILSDARAPARVDLISDEITTMICEGTFFKLNFHGLLNIQDCNFYNNYRRVKRRNAGT